MNEKVKLLIIFVVGILIVSIFTIDSINTIESLNNKVEKNKIMLCSNIKEYNETIKDIINVDKEYNNIDYSLSSDINNKSIKLDESMEEGDIEKINNSFDALMTSSRNLLTVDYDSSNELFTFVIMQTKLSTLETKIFISQQNYNYSVRNYNQIITSFPNAIISVLYGYDTISLFDAN